jgi:hypothetical protein
MIPTAMHRLIQNLAFNQDDIERLAAAYEQAHWALRIRILTFSIRRFHRFLRVAQSLAKS